MSKSKMMSRAYQPKGSKKAPKIIPKLVSGVLFPTHNIKLEIVNKKENN